MTGPLAFIRPGLALAVWAGNGPLVEVTLTRKHALALMRDLATALADNEP